MPFVVGHPRFGGRKKNKDLEDVQRLARAYTKEAVEKLVSLLRGDDPRVAAIAANSLLDRGHGKPSQTVTATVEHSINVGDETGFSAHITRALEKRQKATVQ